MKATKVNAGLAESNARLLLGIWRDSLHVTCGLTTCTPGSAPGPTLGNEYGKTLPFRVGTLHTIGDERLQTVRVYRRCSRVSKMMPALTANCVAAAVGDAATNTGAHCSSDMS